MNYKQSKTILELIDKATNILVNCHIHAGLDSVASSISIASVIRGYGKAVKVVSPYEINNNYFFLEGVGDMTISKFTDIAFNDFDLFIVLDSESWVMLELESAPEISIIAIDHHPNNSIGGNIDLIDSSASSTCEILSRLFEDWEIELDNELATSLMA